MIYNISIDVPEDINYEQSRKAIKNDMQFSDVLIKSIETAMHNLTGNVINVRLNAIYKTEVMNRG